jgi:hypothetical protein
MKDPEQFLTFLISNRIKSFRDELRQVLSDPPSLKAFLLSHARLLFSLNPDEFVDELWAINEMALVHQVASLFEKESSLSWHFLKRIFVRDQYAAQLATETEMVDYVTFLCQYHPSTVFATLVEFREIPVAQILPVCQKYGIADATLYLCDLTQDLSSARDFGTVLLEYGLFDNRAEAVLEQICAFFARRKEREGKTELWLSFMESFRLPLFAAQNDDEKLAPLLRNLDFFLERMILDVDSAVTVARGFSETFAFLPFRIARPHIVGIINAIRRKNEFMGNLVDIVKFEAVEKQLGRMKSLASGVAFDARSCPKCGKVLGQGAAFASRCGHVFHDGCTRDGHCPVCGIEFYGATPIAQQQEAAAPSHSEPPKRAPKPLSSPMIGSGIVSLPRPA